MKRYKVTHIMNKKQLGLILVAGLFCATANAVDLEATGLAGSPVGTVMIANENEIDSKDGTTVSGAAYNVTGKVGFIIPEGATYYVRIDLGGSATFGEDPTTNFDNEAGDSEITASRASGGDGKNYVILSVGGAVTDDTDWTLNETDYSLKSRAAVDFSYKLYENPSDAIAGESDGALAQDSAAFIRFADATSMAGKASNAALIDVGESSTKFERKSTKTHIMEINILNSKGTQVSVDDSTVAINLEAVVDKITLVATGDFNAVKEIKDGDKVTTAGGKVWLDKDDKCTPATPGVDGNEDGDFTDPEDTAANATGDLIGSVATFNDAYLEATVVITNIEHVDDEDPVVPANPGYFGDIAKAFLCMQTNGKTTIPEITYTGELSMTANDDYEAIDDVDFTGSKLQKNSESVVLDFLLTPGGVFRNMVRLTNTSNVDGSDLMVTLTNDGGDEVTFSLGDVEGVSSDLGPRASTPLININLLYAAAQAVELDEDEEMFTVEGDGMGDKLRARFEGNVLAGSLRAQALSVSTDNTTFFTF